LEKKSVFDFSRSNLGMRKEMKLRTISYLHIGNGVNWKSNFYVYERKKVFFFEFEDIVKVFRKYGKPTNAFVNLFVNYISRGTHGSGLGEFFKNQGLNVDLENDSSFKLPALEELGNVKEGAVREIAEFCGGKFVYIPGSSLKGVVRTALLYEYWKKRKGDFERIIKDLRADFKKGKDGFINRADEKISEPFSKEIMSFINFSDSERKPVESVCAVALVKPPPFIPQIVVRPEVEFKFDVKVDEERLEIALKSGKINEEKANIIRNWKKCLYEFSQKLISATSNMYPQFKYFLSSIEKKNTEQSPVINLGKGKGFISNTLWIVLGTKEDDFKYFQDIFRGILRRRGFPPITKRYIDGEIKGEFAQKIQMPMGWCKVIDS